ncbi:winged helix-turn-helix transcriptional regulator [Candidatus Sumerlaeota bacterium]|nr:winged helix-turn-helix transcriptional regulator [Candidatus Sumerlaeota bacterium]
MKDTDRRFFQAHAQFCSVFSHETRLRIVWLLGRGERCVSDIAEDLGLSIQNVSQHLAVMRGKGAVICRKCGQRVCYSIANPKFFEGFLLIRSGLQEIHRELGATASAQKRVGRRPRGSLGRQGAAGAVRGT